MRSALSIIYGFANLLERRDDEALRLEAAAHIQQAATFLEKIVVALLDELEVTFAESPYDQIETRRGPEREPQVNRPPTMASDLAAFQRLEGTWARRPRERKARGWSANVAPRTRVPR